MRILGLAAIVLAAALNGCTASAIMKSYVDKPLIEAVLDYGPPAGSFDMGDGTRAFIWEDTNSITMPGRAMTTGNASVYGFGNTASVYGTQTTTYTPASTSTWSCTYVIFAKQTRTDVEGPAAWTVVDYRKPSSFMCE